MTQKSSRQKLRATVSRAFAERELILRSDGRLAYLRLSPRLQLALFCGLCLIALWGLSTTGAVWLQGHQLTEKDDRIAQQRLAYMELLSEVSEFQREFKGTLESLRGHQDDLQRLLTSENSDKIDRRSIADRLRQSELHRETVEAAHGELSARLGRFQSELTQIADRNSKLEKQILELNDHLSDLKNQKHRLEAEKGKTESTLARLRIELSESGVVRRAIQAEAQSLKQDLATVEAKRRADLERQEGLGQQLAELRIGLGAAREREVSLKAELRRAHASLGAAVARQETIAAERDVLQLRVGLLEVNLDQLKDSQQAMLQRLTERTLLTVDTMERTVAMTGLDVERLLSTFQIEGLGIAQGGPFISTELINLAGSDFGGSLETSAALLDLQMDRWEAFQTIVRSLPLSAPLDQYRISSGYGTRRDPMNGRKAVHEGTDFVAPRNTPVLGTAPGTVVYAGWRGRYGRVVEIDHGLGLVTRYAHLNKILVKPGQVVGHREQIGLVGSSGRSTGPHVHYEVRFEEKPLDPLNFLKAGRYVFKDE